MRLSATLFCIVLLCLGVSGCTSRTVLEPQDTLREAGTARIYFIRPTAIIGAGQSARVTVNNKKVGSLGIGTYFYIDRSAGQYHIVADHEFDFGQAELTLNIVAEKNYYLKIIPGGLSIAVGAYGASGSNKLALVGISEDEAKALLSEMSD